MAYDTLIVGAGSAGAILATRLTEDPAHQVLLVEAGHDVIALPRAERELERVFVGLVGGGRA